jgi:hypothetical protein|tara:strand:- start:449 stop:634 length:186 start_codon:yes stop_codon:yes gene_type:complete
MQSVLPNTGAKLSIGAMFDAAAWAPKRLFGTIAVALVNRVLQALEWRPSGTSDRVNVIVQD